MKTILIIIATLSIVSCTVQTEVPDNLILKTKYPPSREFDCTRSAFNNTTFICKELPLP